MVKKKLIIFLVATAASFTMLNSIAFADNYSNSTASYHRMQYNKKVIKAKKVVQTAKEYIGVPYVWGGTSKNGIDCSGFTQNVFWKNGKPIARTASLQFKEGNWVSKENLQPGDMVFFTTYKPGASHVGIYIGKNKFIHASSGKGAVTISNLTKNYYKQRYIGAKRMID